MYEELVKRLRKRAVNLKEKFSRNAELLSELMQAAAAIEELQEDNAALNGTVSNLIGQIEKLSKPRWIPVTERLPEHLQSVLVHRDDGGVFIYEYFDTSPTDDCWIDDGCNVYSMYNITHWMPLPEPPKEDKP